MNSLLAVLPWILLLLSAVCACAAPPSPEGSTGADPIDDFLERDGRRVLTFVGYSGAGYEDEAEMLRIAGRELDACDPAEVIVNIGVTPDGIGRVYELAKQRGFSTMGIVSSQARAYPASPHVDHPFYVEDDTWGGLLEGTDRLSPTSSRMVACSDVLVGIGGGAVARDELLAARAAGKEVRFHPADLDHERAIEKAREKGQPAPTDFSGEAAKAF